MQFIILGFVCAIKVLCLMNIFVFDGHGNTSQQLLGRSVLDAQKAHTRNLSN